MTGEESHAPASRLFTRTTSIAQAASYTEFLKLRVEYFKSIRFVRHNFEDKIQYKDHRGLRQCR